MWVVAKVRNKELEPEITNFMTTYNVTDLNTENGKLRCHERKTKNSKGIQVVNVVSNSPADLAGLVGSNKVVKTDSGFQLRIGGDVIVKINNHYAYSTLLSFCSGPFAKFRHLHSSPLPLGY